MVPRLPENSVGVVHPMQAFALALPLRRAGPLSVLGPAAYGVRVGLEPTGGLSAPWAAGWKGPGHLQKTQPLWAGRECGVRTEQ